jgi:CO/xanthine dehydrogenase FAD-binding subunit
VTVSSYFQPTSMPEALALLAEHGPELLVIAGGTVAMPLINEGISLPAKVMGLRHLGLSRVELSGGRLWIGATTTLTALTAQPHAPLLAEAARHTAGWQVRNMGTVGGNLFTPPPGGDVATALLALDAQVEVVGPAGVRVVPLGDFWTGFMTTVLAPDELVARLAVPVTGDRQAFLKFGRRSANTPAVVTVAVRAAIEEGVVASARVALGAAGPHPLRSPGAEAVLAGCALTPGIIAEAAAAAAEDVRPFSDSVASAWYRRRMAGVMVQRVLAQLAQPAERGA